MLKKIFNLDFILNKIFFSLSNEVILRYINSQKILTNAPKSLKVKIFKRIYICRKNKLIISLIPKNGNTSIKNFLNTNLNKVSSDNYILTKILSNNFQNYKKIIFFRDPFERFLSGFKDRNIRRNFSIKNLELFIKQLCSKNILFNDQHFAKQSYYILKNLQFYNYVEKINDLNFTLNKIFFILGIKVKNNVKRLNSTKKLNLQINKKKLIIFKKKIFKIYKEDYKIWSKLRLRNFKSKFFYKKM